MTYFFFEWLINSKGIDRDEFVAMSSEEVDRLKVEFATVWNNLK